VADVVKVGSAEARKGAPVLSERHTRLLGGAGGQQRQRARDGKEADAERLGAPVAPSANLAVGAGRYWGSWSHLVSSRIGRQRPPS